MFNIGTPEMVLIAFIALVVVGPQRLPSLFRQIGRAVSQVRKIQDDVKDMVQLDQYIDLKDQEGDFIKPNPTPHRSRVAEEPERHDPIAARAAAAGEADGPAALEASDAPAPLDPTSDPDDEPLSAP